MAAKLKEARLLRDLCNTRLNETFDLASEAILKPELRGLFSRRYQHVEQIATQFARHHETIISLLANTAAPNLDDDDEIRKDFDSKFYAIQDLFAQFFPVNPGASNASSGSAASASMQGTAVRLPELNLRTFDGEFRNWKPFYESFLISIDQTNMAPVNKFRYLISCLKGQPSNMLKSLPLTADNYPIALQKLKDRYDNKRELATIHWEDIVNLSKLNHENASALRSLLDDFKESRAALYALNLGANLEDFLWCNLLMDKLDTETKKAFENECRSITDTYPTFDKLEKFLESQCRMLEISTPKRKSSNVQQRRQSASSGTNMRKTSLVTNIIQCPLCKEHHKIFKCALFMSKTPSERHSYIKSLNLCFNCLKSGHSVLKCPSAFTCKECHQKHHSLLHLTRVSQVATSDDTSEPEIELTQAIVNQAIVNTCKLKTSKSPQILLSTISLEISDQHGIFHKVRCLLDSGSQVSLICNSRVKQLGLRRDASHLDISGLGVSHNSSNGSLSALVRSPSDPNIHFTWKFEILNHICNDLPSSSISPSSLSISPDIKLADPFWYRPGPIDLLLGADVLPLILTEGRLEGDAATPTALNTKFGWILIGPISETGPSVRSLCTNVESLDLEHVLKAFWEIEEVNGRPPVHPDDDFAEEMFSKTFFRDPSGRLGVALPFRASRPCFKNTQIIADRRWIAQERRLLQTPEHLNLYLDFMKDYLVSGHMSHLTHIPSPCYFIPHHSVFKRENGQDKIRVVFNASTKDDNNTSLNDTLLAGPKLQADIVSILLRFRSYLLAFTCDIRQMYRQILVHEEDRNYQLIRFRFSTNDPIQTYRLNTVTYGVSSSAFLAVRALRELAHQSHSQFPAASQALLRDTYVDDIVTGADSLEEALDIRSQLLTCLGSAGLELRKWSSNSHQFLLDLPPSHLQSLPLNFTLDSESVVKILGLQWDAHTDAFSFAVKLDTIICTKRNILSQIARIYDPLGFIGPVVLLAKRLIQVLWTLGLDWDATPPDDVCAQWTRICSQLYTLSEIRIPRCLATSFSAIVEMHGFCDASRHGYAAVIYLRYVHRNQTTVRMLTSKTKVAPLKVLSIPRLELCSAVLLANLIASALKSFEGRLTFTNLVAWTDSMVSLTWIRSPPHKWKTFVANRVSLIQDLVPPPHWRHVPSAKNPADHGSRGLYPEEMTSCALWWEGPPFLQSPCDDWPSSPLIVSSSECQEEEAKTSMILTAPSSTIDRLLRDISSLRKIQGIFAYGFHWLNCIRSRRKVDGALTSVELHQALMVIVKHVQRTQLHEVLAALESGRRLSKPLRKLSPFVDDDGVLRVGGRLRHSSLPFGSKHPALLPSHHRLTQLLIQQIHNFNCHPGVQTTVYLLRQNFYILDARRVVRSSLASCFRCYRLVPKPYQPLMGDLPAPRVSQAKPFSTCGVDFAGPFKIVMSRHRGTRTSKAYLCIFICFATKAVHLEIASDLSTPTFLAALKRFISRRGRVSHIFSDCGTNFVGANRELMSIMQNVTQGEAIRWSFNPPSAPHFGGLWESGVKSVKTHITRVIGLQILTYEELNTLIIQVEALLNSRPISALSTDPNDPLPLTPGHLLTLEPLTAPPEPDFLDINPSRLNRWQLIQRMRQHFWSRWRDEYLHDLFQRSTWSRSDHFEPCEVGTLVLIKDNTLPPLQWKTGRVAATFPGADGVVRVALVKTIDGSFKRPLTKLCPLPNFQ